MAKDTQKQFVKIQSKINITVTAGLQGKDVTNPDAHVADRLKISALWPKCTVDIHEGVGYYPAYIAEWGSVKGLEKDEILSIAGYYDEASQEVKDLKTELDDAIAELKHDNNIVETVKEERELKAKKISSLNLNDIAGE